MKIIIIGCPGSGKSTLAKQLAVEFNLPLLHLDRIFHIDNYNQISREELVRKFRDFALQYKSWIIDGNYISTLEKRIVLADTVIFMKIPSNICVKNIKQRSIEYANKSRTDMAEGFDDSIISEKFIDYVRDFDKVSVPKIESVLVNYPNKRIIQVNSYSDLTSLPSLLQN